MGRRRHAADDFWNYPAARPIRPAQGITAKSRRGSFGTSWWAQRWIGVLEQFGWGSRLTRGRSYARRGQVVRISVGVGQVEASVQGSRPRPYRVLLQIAPLTDAQWEQVLDALAQQALFAAQLLAGEMPTDIEDAFAHVEVPLFPQQRRDLVARCSCPDAANPCKHIAAVYYLLGEQFDDDPFLLFHLRGRTREQVMAALQERRAAVTEETPDAPDLPTEPVAALSEVLEHFYTAGEEMERITVHIAAPERESPLLQRGGTLPAHTEAALRSVYQMMTAHVRDRVFGEDG